MISLKKLQKIIDQNFSEPFLKNGLVTTRLHQKNKKKYLDISIGRRDITIDENGVVNNTGTLLTMGDSLSIVGE